MSADGEKLLDRCGTGSDNLVEEKVLYNFDETLRRYEQWRSGEGMSTVEWIRHKLTVYLWRLINPSHRTTGVDGGFVLEQQLELAGLQAQEKYGQHRAVSGNTEISLEDEMMTGARYFPGLAPHFPRLNQNHFIRIFDNSNNNNNNSNTTTIMNFSNNTSNDKNDKVGSKDDEDVLGPAFLEHLVHLTQDRVDGLDESLKLIHQQYHDALQRQKIELTTVLENRINAAVPVVVNRIRDMGRHNQINCMTGNDFIELLNDAVRVNHST